MQVSFLYQNIFDTSFTHHRLPHLDNRHQTKRVQKSEVYSYIPLSSHSNHTLNILSFTLNLRAMENP